MSQQMHISQVVEAALQSNRFAVLATEGAGQPHASLVAITPFESYRKLIFASYRNTRKFRNLTINGRVAVLFEIGNADTTVLERGFVITAFGHAELIKQEESDALLAAHLKRHPDLETLLHSTECALFIIKVDAFQIVHGIDSVKWWTIGKVDKS